MSISNKGESKLSKFKASGSLNVLVVDEELPFPLNTGKRIRSFNLLKNLAHLHRITFLCHKNKDKSELDLAVNEFEKLGIRVEFLNRRLPASTLLTSKPALFWQLATNFFSRYPFAVQKHLSRELTGRIAEICTHSKIDVIHFEWTPYAGALPQNASHPWVTDAHNVESLIWKRYVQHESNWLRRIYVGRQWRKFDRFERRIFKDATQVVFVSEPDSEIARTDFDCGNRSVVDNGVDVQKFPFTDQSQRDQNRILFLGSLDWRPNIDGIQYFLNEVWPDVHSRKPSLQLDIVGRTPNASFVNRLKSEPNVTLYADVPEVLPFLMRSAMMVVPLRIGGGSRLKILEAAAAGLPVVSTSVGAEGLELEPGVHFEKANSPQEFINILTANRQQTELSVMARSARMLVENRYDWAILSDKLNAVWIDAANSSDELLNDRSSIIPKKRS